MPFIARLNTRIKDPYPHGTALRNNRHHWRYHAQGSISNSKQVRSTRAAWITAEMCIFMQRRQLSAKADFKILLTNYEASTYIQHW